MDIESRVTALKLKIQANPKVPLKEIEPEIRELISLGVQCRRLRDEVGVGNYAIYKLRKEAGLSRRPRPHAKLREVKVIDVQPKLPAQLRQGFTVSLSRDNGGIKISGERSEILAILKGIL